MGRYLIKANFYNSEDLESARKEMVSSGIPLSDIDQLTIGKSRGKHLSFGRVHKGSQLALKFLPIGWIIGTIVYIASTFSSESAPGFWNSLGNISLFNLLFVAFGFGHLFILLGYFFGKKSVINTIEYSGKSGMSGRNVLMVNVDDDFKFAAENILKSHKPASLDIVDSRFEVEVGLRDQEESA